jgi:hypothetical protein
MATTSISCLMNFAATMSLYIAAGRRLTVTLITASALLLMSACGNTNPSSAIPGTEQNQPLTWNTTAWNNSDWT